MRCSDDIVSTYARVGQQGKKRAVSVSERVSVSECVSVSVSAGARV